jgi:hypothetical protein
MTTMRHIINYINENMHTNINDNFWKWFGNSVVKENNEPLTVYHGTNAHIYTGGQIDIFHTLPSSGRGAAFFTSSKQLAGEYGQQIYEVYLRIENPLIVYGNGKHWQSIDNTTKISGKITDELRQHHYKQAKEWADILSDLSLLDDTTPTVFKPKSKIPDTENELDKFNLELISEYSSTDDIVKQARKFGYDGVIFKNIIDSPTADKHIYKNTPSDVFAVFKGNQIKSVKNNGLWSLNDSDIMN